jgi:hypothetical protein
MSKTSLKALVSLAVVLIGLGVYAQDSNRPSAAAVTCTAPEFVTPPVSLTSSHCQSFNYTFTAQNSGESPMFYRIVSGPGVIDSATGTWTYEPSLADVGAGLKLVVEACDTCAGCGAPATVELIVTNQAPQITCPVILKLLIQGDTARTYVSATDDCDPVHYSLGAIVPYFDGQVLLNSTTGEMLLVTPGPSTSGAFYVEVFAGDGKDSTSCEIPFKIIPDGDYRLRIGSQYNSVQGRNATLPVSLSSGDPVEGLGSFNILLGYDASALAFRGAQLGEAFGPSGCGWEYFSYRYNSDSSCSPECPTGMLRLIGVAEAYGGPSHPSCFLPTPLPTVLFNLNFLVSNNFKFSCQYLPVRFFWTDCSDNTLSNTTGDRLFISHIVAEAESPLVNIADPNAGFPTYLGAQSQCETGQPDDPVPLRIVGFVNGGFDLVCDDSLDIRGDINCNGFRYEMADAVMYANFFSIGLPAFAPYFECAIAASDVNGDSVVLSVADLVYLLRVILGDVPMPAKAVPVSVNYSIADGVLSAPIEIGAVFAVVKGNVTPVLRATNMEMKYAFDGVNTRILVYPNFDGVTSLATMRGEIVQVNSEYISVEMSTPEGAMVVGAVVPSTCVLAQNYPNPFNPTTEIQFSLANTAEVTLDIFNITGQHVRSMVAGSMSAGVHKVEWDGAADNGRPVASGIYIYRLRAGEFTSSKKMMLIR